MNHADHIRRLWNDNVPYSAMVELTYRCNLDCFFCYNDRRLPGTPLSVEQYRTLFQDLAALGTLNLVLTGGEPLAHPAFFTLGRLARDLGFAIRVKTNGHALRGRLLRRLLAEVEPFSVDVSLHGARAATHDRQTRVPGSFQRLLENLPAMRDAGLRIRVNATLTRWNEAELEAMYALMDAMGLTLQVSPEVTPRDDGDRSPAAINPSPGAVGRLLALQQARLRDQGIDPDADADEAATVSTDKHCGAGSATMTVDPHGNVYPCVQFRRRLGNLHEQSIREIWAHSPALSTVRQQIVEAKSLLDRERAAGRPLTGFCPGNAHAQTGSPLVFHPMARLRQELEGSAGS